MQKAYFVIPDVEEVFKGYTEICKLRESLENGHYKVDRDYIEASSLCTCAYIILTEAKKIATENAELTTSEGEDMYNEYQELSMKHNDTEYTE